MPNLSRLIENFEDILKEKECERKGDAIPSYLKGTMLRNGPGIFNHGETVYKHWFDGDAYIQRYAFRDGKMYYSARAINSDSHLKNSKANRIVVGCFGTASFPDPCKNIFERFFSYFQKENPTDNANVAFQELGDQVYALTEAPVMIPIEPDTLNVGNTTYTSESLFSLHTSTAHSHVDENGDVINIGSRFGKNSVYVVVKLKAKKESNASPPYDAELLATVDCAPEGPCYYHSFGMSEGHFVLLESPLRINVFTLAFRRILGASYQDGIQWKEGIEHTNVVVVDRKTGERTTTKYITDACFTFHHANTFERDGCLVVDYSKYRKAQDLDALSLNALRSQDFFQAATEQDFIPFAHRLVVPLNIPEDAKEGEDLLKEIPWAKGCSAVVQADGSIFLKDVRLCEQSLEFPRYNYERCNAKEYKYQFGSTVLNLGQDVAGVVKVYNEERRAENWEVDHSDQLTGEPIFVADPNGKEEDDGVLIVPVMTVRKDDRPYVVVLDAKTMEEKTRFVIPVDRIPFGFHGHYTEKHSRVAPKDINDI